MIMIGEPRIENIIDNYRDNHRIIKVLDYQVNWKWLNDIVTEILNLICTQAAHAKHSW